jgi:plasmid stabilization system protein ParE
VTFRVALTREAEEDLVRLEQFLVDAAIDSGDFDLPLRAVEAIRTELGVLERNPFTCRKTGQDPLERELVIPFGRSGYLALFHIHGPDEVWVSAIRHQREDDYH